MLQKTTWMRFLIVGNIMILLVFLGCETADIDNIKTVDYIYKNNTGTNLTLEVYNSRNELLKKYSITNGSEIKTNTTRAEVPSLFYFEPFEDKIGNSVVIKFDNNTCLYYNKGNSDRIFTIEEYDNYTEDLLKQSKYSLIYTFTAVDYSKAVICN